MSNARASQVVVEVLSRRDLGSGVRASQIVMTVLTTRPRVVPPPPFPVPPGSPGVFSILKGLSYSVQKTAVLSTGIAPHISGREVRINYYPAPLWQWELTFDYLPDTGIADATSAPGVSDYQMLRAFFTSTYGGTFPFFFFDPDDFAVVNQPIATTDGATRTYILSRTYGAGGFSTTEPVGFVDATNFPFNVYLNNTIVSTSLYKLTTTQFGNQIITFLVAPTSGQSLTVDMTYYYFARFMDPILEFEEFIHRVYMLKKLRLESRRST